MKKLISVLGLMVLVSTTVARADGFVCQGEDEALNIRVFNHVSPEDGTRVGAVMVLSDAGVGHGRKTIARFNEEAGTLTSNGATYVGLVDRRFNDLTRDGELLMGTKLGEVKTVRVAIGFSYSEPVEAGEELNGRVTLNLRNGSRISQPLVCTRYLKGASL